MPYVFTDFTTKIQFVTSAEMPSLIYRACLATDTVSNTVYVQHAVAEALARDLNIPLEDILAKLPPPRGKARDLIHPQTRQPIARPRMIGPAGTIEDVK